MIGMGERTSPQAVAQLARSLFAHEAGEATVMAAAMPELARQADMRLTPYSRFATAIWSRSFRRS